MTKKSFLQILSTHAQTLVPQHALSQFAGWLANSTNPALKNKLIHYFLGKYNINLAEAINSDPEAYASFNDFFTRALKPGVRHLSPDAKAIVSPADGCFAELGQINHAQLIQAKGMVYDLPSLFGGDATATDFNQGQFATIYLAPHNYHRVHMPYTGRLLKTIYVPGRLFSVNRMTTDLIPNLYARNERLICLFETGIGPMAVILVGAMIVGSMQTVWMNKPLRAKHLQVDSPPTPLTLNQGDELGHFSLGSTVIMLFAKDASQWLANIQPGNEVQVFEKIALIK
ncbi:MAG TPA: archaetidylserine decarboxylase [Gammaproteobacteria bacterium]|nr:archaetidylserine decarboxylase [Gammaproteobacteria bacterium]